MTGNTAGRSTSHESAGPIGGSGENKDGRKMEVDTKGAERQGEGSGERGDGAWERATQGDGVEVQGEVRGEVQGEREGSASPTEMALMCDEEADALVEGGE
jgi:hypothetical protein